MKVQKIYHRDELVKIICFKVKCWNQQWYQQHWNSTDERKSQTGSFFGVDPALYHKNVLVTVD